MSLICIKLNTSYTVIYNSRPNIVVFKNSLKLLRIKKELCVCVCVRVFVTYAYVFNF